MGHIFTRDEVDHSFKTLWGEYQFLHYHNYFLLQELEIMNLKRSHQQNLSDISQVNFSNLIFEIKTYLLQALFKLQSSLVNKEKMLDNVILEKEQVWWEYIKISKLLFSWSSIIYYFPYLSSATIQMLTIIKNLLKMISVLLMQTLLDYTRTTESN